MRTLYLRIRENQQVIFQWIKWLSIPLIFLALYYQLFVQKDFSDAIQIFQEGLSHKSWAFLALVLLLMPINLGIEAIKWKKLLQKTHKINFFTSLQSVFAGISFSIFTPKRLGDFAGRLMVVNKDKVSAAGSLFVGNFSQMVSNFLLGFLSLAFFLRHYDLEIEHVRLLLILAVIMSAMLLYCYFHLNILFPIFRRIPYLERLLDKLKVIASYQNQTLFSFLSLSLLKYCVFVLQFVLLLYVFGIEIQLFWAMIAAACVFFVKTLLPMTAFMELAARGSIAIYFFSFFSENHIGILVASTVLWVINLALPALIGSYFLSKTRL